MSLQLIIDLLKALDILHDSLHGDTVSYEASCSYTPEQMKDKANVIKSLATLVQTLDINLSSELTGRKLIVYNAFEVFRNYRTGSLISYAQNYQDVIDDSECGKSIPRLHGRLYFIKSHIDYLSDVYEAINRV